MMAGQIWSNVLAWTLQIGAVLAIGGLLPALLKLREPRLRLVYWQVLLVACLALPWVRTWRQEVVAGAAQVSTAITAAPASPSSPAPRPVPWPEAALWCLAAGVAVRLGLMGVGLRRLAAYRSRGERIPSEPGTYGVSLLVSPDVTGPVTFGWRDPVVLLPATFPALPDGIKDAILCHELLHVARHDWLFTIAEELVRSVLWFHPGVWWVLGEIQLAREQTVDRAVVETTRARDSYIDTLLLMAGAGVSGRQPEMELAPAPMFLRRRHLKRRLMEVSQEVRMKKVSATRLACVTGVAAITLTAACWLATGAFPLIAAPQIVEDAAGVSVNTNGSPLLHRSSVPYPADALAKGIEGTVVVQLKLDAGGEVSDAAVLSGPDDLRKGVLQSVLAWHFEKSVASSTRTVNIDFVKPANAVVPAKPTENVQMLQQLQQMQRQAKMAGSASMAPPPPPPPPPPPISGTLDRIVMRGLSDSARADLLSRLPVQEHGPWTGQSLAAVKEAVARFDSHLSVVLGRSATGELSLNIGVGPTPITVASGAPLVALTAPVPSAEAVASPSPEGVFSVGNGVSPPSVVRKVDPVYTEEARAAKLSGSVMLSIVVGTDGKADNIRVVRGLGMGLDEMAVASLQQWVFRPGSNQGVPVKVRAMVEINFRLLDKE